MPRSGSRRRKRRTHIVENESAQTALQSNEASKIPRSVVIRRGKASPQVIELLHDLRKTLLPYTALNLNEDAKNRKLKLTDYVKHFTTPMGITHLLTLTQNTRSSNLHLRMCRTPSGPTLSFRLKQFTLAKHVRQIQKRPFDATILYQNPPIVVTNNFGEKDVEPHIKLMRITFQNLFPPVNVASVKLSECRRVVLFHFVKTVEEMKTKEGEGEERRPDGTMEDVDNNAPKDDDDDAPEDEEVEVRHYAIRAKPIGVDRRIRKILHAKLPDLGKLNDISEFLMQQSSSAATGAADTSDSEPEDETSHVVLPQDYSRGFNKKHQKSALKLVELGPRLKLKLVKVERGLGCGDVMYHAYVKKSMEEVKELKMRVERKDMEKKRRREEQEMNVERKKRTKEEKREKKKRRKEEREKRIMQELRGEVKGNEIEREEEEDDDDNDDDDDKDSGDDNSSSSEEETKSEEENSDDKSLE